MSDIHGCLDAFEYALTLVDLSGDNKLILLGDYVHGPDSYGVLKKIMQLQNKYGSDKVIALLGNHEDMACDGRWRIKGNENTDDRKEDDAGYLRWMKNLPRYYSEGNTIFVHAGIDEEAEDLWKWGTDDYTFTEKYPAQTGRFYNDMKIVAGHIGTAEISGNPRFHDIYYDGESHYYIDGTVLESGIIPVIKIDTKNNKYYRVTDTGAWLILPYEEEN
ncbi:MAG: metallophosphoesterase [Lachnospiraceae bacterium]|nr:metallophosphoesterase [Lachnospiraceae bacterium]